MTAQGEGGPEITAPCGVNLWQGKPLEECSKESLIAAVGILHRTLNAVHTPPADTQRTAELEAVLMKCRDQFSTYEALHLSKGTPDADEKAATNYAFKDMCYEALARALSADDKGERG
jgi:hypothetical protein